MFFLASIRAPTVVYASVTRLKRIEAAHEILSNYYCSMTGLICCVISSLLFCPEKFLSFDRQCLHFYLFFKNTNFIFFCSLKQSSILSLFVRLSLQSSTNDSGIPRCLRDWNLKLWAWKIWNHLSNDNKHATKLLFCPVVGSPPS